ncbi:protein LIKE COV 3 isoform X4 [Manihot esculenta]|uniref:protein LIKE COV 3 isoform X4 n=1 Tax=Manihot esculenta TaxID=3983 RepID=UPI000B5D76BE|nr:protein LIKE COV 3 isoform X4 [Manihot esculenta]
METRERDIERLMPIQAIKNRDNNNTGFSNSSSETVSPLVSSSHHSAGREAFCKVIRSWASKKFMTGCRGWELLFLTLENGSSRKCLLLAISTLPLNKSVQR